MGYILLEGGSEFQGQMAEPDRQALTLAGGLDAMVSIIPTAAVPDNNHLRAGSRGIAWFRKLGATNVSTPPLFNHASAGDPRIAADLERSALIYLLGGFPGYLAQVLAGSRAWQAMAKAYESGAMIAGSSAGAMVLCQHYYDPKTNRISPGLNLVEGICVLPHHNTAGAAWASELATQLHDITLMGIDEQTGALFHRSDEQWRVSGKGAVTLYSTSHQGRRDTYLAGKTFSL